jgi:hypothetical protein
MPVAVRDDEVAGPGDGDARLHGGKDVADRSRARQVDTGAAAGARKMVVHQAGDHGAAAQVDHARGRAGERAQLIVVADGEDAVAADGDALVNGKGAVDGNDPAAVKDEVGRRRPGQDGRLRNGGGRDDRDDRGSNHPAAALTAEEYPVAGTARKCNHA